MDLNIPSPIEKMTSNLFEEKKLTVYIKRDDLIHSEISGNKWRKLKFNIEKYKQGKYNAILTFGGAYSNHIAATAHLCEVLDIPCIGIIRGEELTSKSNDTLLNASKNGMQLKFVSRSQYAERYEKLYWQKLRTEYGNILIIPEGGANFLGMQGCAEILTEIPFFTDYIITASGTGTTAAGLLFNSTETEVVSVPVFKKGDFILDEIRDLLMFSGLTSTDISDKMKMLKLDCRFHFGGYGKFTQELIGFMNEFHESFGIPLDQIYTAKMVFAFLKKVNENYFKRDSTIVLLHTGGIQGTATVKDILNY
ncbi:MAG: 1-aminocyclopropane-1-carboxylate deaminase/D-cysteine desulfhydrase [Crocinitomicaceae bacterium]